MAKRRKRRRAKAITRFRTRTVTKYRTRKAPSRRRRRRSGGRGGGGGMLGGIIPPKHELYDMGGAAVFGALERKSKADDSFILNKLPKPITPLGFSGNIALAARLAHKFLFRHPLLLHFARGTACVAAYQIARQGALFTSASPNAFTVSGYDDEIAGDLDEEQMGALAAEGASAGYYDDDDVGRIPYDAPDDYVPAD